MVTEIADELDPVLEKLLDEEKDIRKTIEKWEKSKDKGLPFVKDLLMLGCHISLSKPHIYVTLSGDKDKFLKFIRIHRRYGHKPNIPAKGETQATWFIYIGESEFFMHFTSTVCKRVQTGTKMQPVPIYETVCEEFVPDTAELDAPEAAELPAPAPAQLEDSIPF